MNQERNTKSKTITNKSRTNSKQEHTPIQKKSKLKSGQTKVKQNQT